MIPDARGLARIITVPELLRHERWRPRRRNRADCGLCRGNSTGTVSYTERFWYCHRCNGGGDVFTFIQKVNQCSFPEALRYMAGIAGLRIDDGRGASFRSQLAARKRARERLEAAAQKLAKVERWLLLCCRARIHECERKRDKASERLLRLNLCEVEHFASEAESLWATLQTISNLLRSELATYSVLTFGTESVRARFALHPEERNEIITDVLATGFVRGTDGRLVEVLA